MPKIQDAVYTRTRALFSRLGISESAYPRILEASIVHAATAPAPKTDPVWLSVGPRNIGGRLQALAQHPDVPNTIFVGSGHGGVWRSVNRGDTWERLGDPQFTFPVGALAMTGSKTNILYVGTGSPLQNYVSGRGLYRVLFDDVNGNPDFEQLAGVPDDRLPPASAKGGAAFRYTRIRVDPDDDTRFWVASQTGLWRCEVANAKGSVPVFRREFPDKDNKPDEAKLKDSFISNISWPAYATDVLVSHDPRDDEMFDATIKGAKKSVRRYLILYVGISGKGVWRGRFDRKTEETEFEKKPLDVPDSSLTSYRRVRLAQCERKPEHVFAVVSTVPADSASEVFHSSNNGNSWTKGKTTVPGAGQAEYDLVLECAPDDERVLVCGAVELALSTDGGDTWNHILDSKKYDGGDDAQHADQHIAMFDAASHRQLWVGNDGGLSLARDLRAPTQSANYWRKRSHGIFAGMFQDITTSPFYPFASAGGLQDNGSWVGYGGLTWYASDGGDGGMGAIDHADPHQVFATWQGTDPSTAPATAGIDVGSAIPFDSASTGFEMVRASLADLPAAIAPGGLMKFNTVDFSPGLPATPLFVGVIEQHPVNAGELLAGRAGDAFATVNSGVVWTSLLSGTIGAAEEAGAIAYGPIDTNAVPAGTDAWIGTDLGNLFQTNAASAGAWNPVPTALPWPGGTAQNIARILVHPNDRFLVVVCSGGTSGRVFVSYDRGSQWTDITEPIPTKIAISAPAGDLQAEHTRQFLATATYADASTRDVTTTVTWASSAVAVAKVGDKEFDKGRVTGVAVGASTITATWTVGVTAPLTDTRVVNVVKKEDKAPEVGSPPFRPTHRDALPPCPMTSLMFDPTIAAGAPQRLLVGTLAGVYRLPNIPAITSLALVPPGALTMQVNAAAVQVSCVATFSDGSTRDVTTSVDWSVTGGAGPTIGTSFPTHGQVTPGANIGVFTVQAARGTIAPVTLTLNVVAAAPAFVPPGGLPASTPPTVPIAWRPFGQGLPLALVADFSRVGTTTRIRAATFGLGIFECDMGAQTAHHLVIRQTVIDDGRIIPRAIPTIPAAGVVIVPPPPPVPLNDPRMPQTGPRAVPMDFTHAFDIRVDAPPYSFFDDVLDGVEFDERLRVDDPVPTEINYVYVQVQNLGVEAIEKVTLHLFVAECDPIPAIGTSPPVLNAPATLDAAAPVADFYGQTDLDPIAGSRWTRVDTKKTLKRVDPNSPIVTRFTWVPDIALGTKSVALLAICSGPDATHDGLPAAPAGATVSALILGERRAALRIVTVAKRPDASVFIRDGASDDTRLGGYPVGGRSPDIMVVRPDIAVAPAVAFKDPLARRAADNLSATGTNFIYVRVHNRRRFETKVNVKVFAIAMNDANQPETDRSKWTELPSAAAFADVTVPASDVGYATVQFPTAPDPNPAGTNKVYLLLALVQAEDATDRLPNKDRVDSTDAFWEFVSKFADSDNAAARAIPWVP